MTAGKEVIPTAYRTSKRMISNVYNDPVDTGLLGFAAYTASEDEKITGAARALLTGLSADFWKLTELKVSKIDFYWKIMHLLVAIAKSPKLAGIFTVSASRALQSLIQKEATV